MKAKSRLEKYKRFATVIGALIVFVTFVVKDAIRDRVKETVDAFQAADYQFTESSDVAYISTLLFTINDNIVVSSRKGDIDARTPLLDADVWVQQDRVLVGNLKKLVERLPGDETGVHLS